MRKAEAIKRLKAAAAEYGATVEDDSFGSWITLQLCAPEGKVWTESWSRHLVVSTPRGPQAWLDDAVDDGIERMKYGLSDEEEDI